MANHKNTEEKFWLNVNKETASGCWEWTGTLWASGYGRFQFNLKSDRAHRLAWMFLVGQISDSECLLHKCDNRKCCNPLHLFIGTRRENNIDKVNKGRQSKGGSVYTAKINEKLVMEIRSSKLTSKELSNIYGLTFGHIVKIKGKRSWSHVK